MAESPHPNPAEWLRDYEIERDRDVGARLAAVYRLLAEAGRRDHASLIRLRDVDRASLTLKPNAAGEQ